MGAASSRQVHFLKKKNVLLGNTRFFRQRHDRLRLDPVLALRIEGEGIRSPHDALVIGRFGLPRDLRVVLRDLDVLQFDLGMGSLQRVEDLLQGLADAVSSVKCRRTVVHDLVDDGIVTVVLQHLVHRLFVVVGVMVFQNLQLVRIVRSVDIFGMPKRLLFCCTRDGGCRFCSFLLRHGNFLNQFGYLRAYSDGGA